MNAVYIERMETLKVEISEAIESGIYASLPADESGITPQTRLLWGIDSVNYIAEVGKNLEDIDRHILNALEQTDRGNPDKVVLVICRSIEAQSGDCYVTEGIDNIQRCMSILGPIDNELRKLRIRLSTLEREVEESRARAYAATKEAIRLAMLLEHIYDNIERQGKPT